MSVMCMLNDLNGYQKKQLTNRYDKRNFGRIQLIERPRKTNAATDALFHQNIAVLKNENNAG